MLRACRDPNEPHPDKNNAWIMLNDEGKQTSDPMTLPWPIETEEDALTAMIEIKGQREAEAAAEAKSEPKGNAAKKAPVDPAMQAKLDAAIDEGAKALRDQLADKADEIVAHEPNDTTLLRVLADVVTQAGPAIRELGLDRRALIDKLQERLPPKSAIIKM